MLNKLPFLKFPHFIRKITAGIPLRLIKYFLWILIACTIVANLFSGQFLAAGEEKQLRLAIMTHPADSALHEKLGQHYLNINREIAEKEYYLAEICYKQSDQPNGQVLGEKSSPWQTWTNIVSSEDKIKEEIKYWEKLAAIFPDYSHVKMRLAVSYYLLGEKDKSHAFIQTILKENPADESVLKLKNELK